MSNESEVYLLSQHEAEALVQKSHQEVLNWVKEALVRFPEYSVEQVLETAQNTISKSRVDLGDDYSQLDEINVADVLKDITKETIDSKGLTVELENVELLTHVENASDDVGFDSLGEGSIFDALVQQTGLEFNSTTESSTNNASFGAAVVEADSVENIANIFETNMDTEEAVPESVAHGEEAEKSIDDYNDDVVEAGLIFDALAEKTGLSFNEDDSKTDTELTIDTTPVDAAQSEPELIFDTLANEKGLSFTEHGTVEEENEMVEVETFETNVDYVDSDTSIFDTLAAAAGLDLTVPEGETVDSTVNSETGNSTAIEPDEAIEMVDAAELVETVEEGEKESGVDGVWGEMLASSEIVEEEQKIEESEIIDDSVSLDWFEPSDKKSSAVANEEEAILTGLPHQELSSESSNFEEESLEDVANEETTSIEEIEDLNEELEDLNEEIEDLNEKAEEVINAEIMEPVVENTVINRYEYVDSEDDSDVNDDGEISLYKEYSTEEAGEIINNTLKTQEFDKDKKLVSQNSGSDVEFDIVNKEYEPGEEYTIITENIIEKTEDENPERFEEYGSDVNISLGSTYEAPEDEQVIIPESEITVDVADINNEIRKRKLFGKDNKESESYEEEAVIPVVEIDEEELNANANSEGLSREGRNIGLAGMGSNEIEIPDDVYEAQQEGLTARDFSEQNNEDMDIDGQADGEDVGEDEEDVEKDGFVRKDLNTRQLIKDVKIIDSF